MRIDAVNKQKKYSFHLIWNQKSMEEEEGDHF
jgi:hypothetical protein